jgi:uncharacterized iron-regulated membrane protein
MNLLRKLLILAHRYLGIALSLLAVLWFATGIVMMYAGGMPQLTAQMRRDRLPDLDLSRVRLSPAEAVAEAISTTDSSAFDRDGRPTRRLTGGGRILLLTVMDRPAYRVGGATVFADTGEVRSEASRADALTIASRFVRVPEARVTYVRTLTSTDQWTLGQNRALPLHKFQVDDGDATEVYVQQQTGEITVMTTRRSRMLAWIGTIPHWMYFTALRNNHKVWFRFMVSTSAVLCVVAMLGLILSVTQFRKTRPFRLARAIPYSGWMRWHYVSGAIFGVFTLTWAFSGLLSMEPFEWTEAAGVAVPRDVFTGGLINLSKFAAPDAATWSRVLNGRAIKEVEFERIQDEHYYIVRQAPVVRAGAQPAERLHQPYSVVGSVERDRVLLAADTLEVRREPFSTESLVARLKAALPDVPIVETTSLSDYDSYYYSRGRQTPLPVVRVKFGDPAQTWFYIDPETSQIVSSLHRLNRVERWLYNGLHSLDFPFWYDKRPLWDVGMIVLLLGGLASSGLGLFLGFRRVWNAAVRSARSLAGRSATVPASAAPVSGSALRRSGM